MGVSVSKRVADYVAATAENSFIAVSDVDGSRRAVETAFSRLAAEGGLHRIRRGIYWKGTPTDMGVSPPSVEQVALVIGGTGSGPAGVAAARWLGLTTQVPSTYLAAVPGRAPAPWCEVCFVQRPVSRLINAVTPSEVAVLEVLRAGPVVVESGWSRLGAILAKLVSAGDVRPAVLRAAADSEPHRNARARWYRLQQSQPVLNPTP